MASYLVYVCQAVKNRLGLEDYWKVAPATFPEGIDVLCAYTPFEVLEGDPSELVEGVVLAAFPPFEETSRWYDGEAYVGARKHREGNQYLGMLVDGGVIPIGERLPPPKFSDMSQPLP